MTSNSRGQSGPGGEPSGTAQRRADAAQGDAVDSGAGHADGDARGRQVGPPVQIGTPLSPTATRVMVLGAGELGKEVVIAFQRLGVEVIAVDRYANAPGHQVAHHAEVIDMTNGRQIIDLVTRYRPHYVVPEIEAIATEALVEVEKRGLAEVIPTAGAVVATMDREGIRRLADEELGLPTSPYLFADSLDDLRVAAEEIGFPCVVKPVMSSSGKGQTVLRGPADVERAWQTAATGGRVVGTRVIVEGFIEFDYEITLLTVRALDPSTGQLVTHFCAPIGHQQVNGDYVESWQPHEMTADLLGAATSVAARIATALGDGKLSGRGVFGIEMFIKGDDVYFSEVSPRPHDTGLVTMATQRLSEFEMHARAILGLPVDVTLASPGASAVIYGQLDEPAIGFSDVARALTVPETDIRLFGKPDSFHRRRMGVITATADDVDTARERAVAAASTVTPVHGRPLERVTAPPPAPAVVATPPAPRRMTDNPGETGDPRKTDNVVPKRNPAPPTLAPPHAGRPNPGPANGAPRNGAPPRGATPPPGPPPLGPNGRPPVPPRAAPPRGGGRPVPPPVGQPGRSVHVGRPPGPPPHRPSGDPSRASVD